MIGKGLRNRGVLLVVGFLAASFVLILAAGSADAFPEDEVSFRIVGFGDKDCTNGSGRLSTSSAAPFQIEVCVEVEGEGPVSGLALTAVVTHADGTIEEIPITTGADGSVIFEVVPVDAGLTLVEICDDDGCDHGSVEQEATDPPRPPAIASYLGPTNDMGASEPIEDGIDDFEDPSTSDAAESGSGEAAMDIASFRYLGTENGVARFEITTRGNACEIFRELVPLAQLSIAVTTPDGGRYFIGYRLSDGTETTFASSEGAILDGVTVSLEEWVNESTAILAVTGVDVPVGSTLLAGTWLIRDDASSGFQDFAEGTATPIAISDDEEPVATELDEPVATEQDPEEQQETATATPSTTTDDDTGSFPIWIPLVVLGAAVCGYFIYRNTQTRVTTTQTTDARDITDTDLEQYRDGDLSSYTDVYAPATTMTTSFDEDWTALLAIEDEIQKRYMDDLKSLLTEVVAKYNAFHTAITLFKEKFVKIASGSTGLQGYLQRWFDVRKTAQKQDLAFGIITLVWGAGSLGLKGIKWLRAPKAATSVETGAARVLGSADELATGETVLA
ncbi:MAG: hypothetical protein IIB04_06010 [Acidobacteria bacterium]|nr:hypothetical protein [Acidobacteriota bacterium]